VSKNSRHCWVHVLLDDRSPPQIMDAIVSPMLVLIRLSYVRALLPLALELLIVSCAMMVLTLIVVSNAMLLSVLTLPLAIVLLKFTSEWSLLGVTFWKFEERGE